MAGYRQLYRESFAWAGRTLRASDASPRDSLRAASQRLGVSIPAALREYYLVAGREKTLNRCHHRLLPPSEWFVNRGRLVFMVENQAVVYWGVKLSAKEKSDPPVDQGVNDEPIKWYRESPHCSSFLRMMLLCQAVFGGMPYNRHATINDVVVAELQRDWLHVGELGGIHIYRQENCVIAGGYQLAMLPGKECLMLDVGASTKAALDRAKGSLSVQW